MGVILDIVEKVVPKVQKRIADEGIGIKQAVNEELKKLGYWPNKKESESYEE